MIYFTLTGAMKFARFTEDSVIERLVKSKFHCVITSITFHVFLVICLLKLYEFPSYCFPTATYKITFFRLTWWPVYKYEEWHSSYLYTVCQLSEKVL